MNDERNNEERKDPRGDLSAADKRSQDERPAGPSTRTPAPGKGTSLGPLPPGVKPGDPEADETQHPRVAGSLRRDFLREPEHDPWSSDTDLDAADMPSEGPESPVQDPVGNRSVSPVGKLLGGNIVNQEGEQLGSVEDLVFDTAGGQIAYVVLSSGGFLGMGEKLVAIPWDAIRFDPSTERFVLNVRQEAIEEAPGFDKNDWPDMADPKWATQVHAHYNYPPYWDWELT